MLKRLWLLLCVPALIFAQDGARVHQGVIVPLGGKPTLLLNVTVEKGAEPFVNQEELKTEIELLLRRNNIPYYKQPKQGMDVAALFITVEGMKVEDDPSYIYFIQIELCEFAKSLRSNLVSFPAVWQDYVFGIVGTKKKDFVKESALKLMNKFALHYLEANDTSK